MNVASPDESNEEAGLEEGNEQSIQREPPPEDDPIEASSSKANIINK